MEKVLLAYMIVQATCGNGVPHAGRNRILMLSIQKNGTVNTWKGKIYAFCEAAHGTTRPKPPAVPTASSFNPMGGLNEVGFESLSRINITKRKGSTRVTVFIAKKMSKYQLQAGEVVKWQIGSRVKLD